ncbi:MAG TPA: NADH-quinone oxidoreductase subunit NuoH [Planctomycetota bacterium]|nr:NADH-quinone oxidoreductase subunit NuoH [Planctomycetota bacterium]
MNEWVALFLKIGFVLLLILQGVPVLIWLERKISAFIQGRVGPNRTALFGITAGGFFQPVADAIKLFFKEDITPTAVDRFLYFAAPILVFAPPVLAFAVIPFGNRIGDEHLQIANLPIGVLFAMSVMSIGVYGIAFGGWASHSKYSLLGGLRSSAQMISYELTLGLAIMLAIMLSGSVDMREIVNHQIEAGRGIFGWNVFGGGNLWLAPFGLLGAILFYAASLAENNRLPFDLPECEAELVAGYHTEYSSMKYAMFMLAEYAAMITMSALLTTLFLGGWHFPGITDPRDHSLGGGILSHLVFATKMGAILFTTIWIRWTLPRFRYDQLMNLGWKGLIPVSLANLACVAVIEVLTNPKH